MVGDFVLPAEWQARRRREGLGGDPERRRARLSQVAGDVVDDRWASREIAQPATPG